MLLFAPSLKKRRLIILSVLLVNLGCHNPDEQINPSPYDTSSNHGFSQTEILDKPLLRGVVLQKEEDGTRYSCALLSLLTAYNACWGLEGIAVADEEKYPRVLRSYSRPSFKSLIKFYDAMPYHGRTTQEGHLYRYTPKTYLMRHGYTGAELEKKLKYYNGPLVHYSSKKIGNRAWTEGMRHLGLSYYELDPRFITKKEFKAQIRKAIEEPGTVLMFHGFNHYTCIGGYSILENGGLAIQISFSNQKPNVWTPLAKIVNNLKKYRNSKLYVVTKA